VLLVDDDPDMVGLLETELHAEGVRVLKATTGESALRLARQEHPTLILLDLYLPRIDGLAVCRILRADPGPHLRHVPIVMLTGVKLHETDLVEAFRAGATDYLTKPVKPTLVRSRVRAWLLRTAPV
jgi:DNA-binding response OmpR family regulator